MTWRSIYLKSNGRLLSVGQRWTEPPRLETDFLETAERPDQGGDMWDETSRDWVPRPPKVLIDRWDDLLADPDFGPGHATIPPPFRASVESAVKRLLGEERFRNVNDSLEIGR